MNCLFHPNARACAIVCVLREACFRTSFRKSPISMLRSLYSTLFQAGERIRVNAFI